MPNMEGDLLVFFAVLSALSFLLFLLFGRDEKLGEAVQKRPPSGMTPAEIGYVIDGHVDYSDVISLLAYWADKGFLKIVREKDSSYRLRKLRELDGDAKPYERYLFSWVFIHGDEADAWQFRAIGFRSILNKTRRMVVKSVTQGRSGLFTKSSLLVRSILAVFTALPMLSCLYVSFSMEISGVGAVVGASVLSVFLLMPEYGVIGFLQRWRGWRPDIRAATLAGKLAPVIIAFAAFSFFYFREDSNVVLAVSAMAATAAIGMCCVFSVKRSAFGNEMLAMAEGLRRFQMEAGEEELAQLQRDDPGYFSRMFSYAFVFNICAQWSEKFDTLPVQTPGWLIGAADCYVSKVRPSLFSKAVSGALVGLLFNAVVTSYRGYRYNYLYEMKDK